MRSALIALLLAAAPLPAAELADPMRPNYGLSADDGRPEAAGPLRLSAVFISGERRIAVINGRRLRVGDTIDGATVSGIERDRVRFTRGDEAFTVTLLSGLGRQ